MAAGILIECLACVPSDEAGWLQLSKDRFPVEALPSGELQDLIGYRFHRGALAIATRPAVTTLGPSTVFPGGDILVLWNVTDPENLGGLIRSAVAFGFSAVVLGPGCADPFYRKTLRSSMGNVLSCPLFSVDLDGLPSLKRDGRMLVAAALGGLSADLGEFKPPALLALVLGNEGWGLPGVVLSACDAAVSIPMVAGVDSLNVAAAGAVLMYVLARHGVKFPL
ncbi:MAG: RNA methyltransferase [Spirochaetes bacterium]|nr:RNA methyltransferase [Spirochaetota bacterium]